MIIMEDLEFLFVHFKQKYVCVKLGNYVKKDCLF